MKKLIFILVLLVALSAAMAQTPVSMRNFALATVIDGEWEQIYDPIDLNFYLQHYYFTNLADYSRKIFLFDDQVEFEDKGGFLSEYPFGMSFRNPWNKDCKHAFLIRFRDNRLPNLSSDYGENETVDTRFYDSDADLLIDTKETTVTRNKDYDGMDSRLLLLLNSSMPMGDDVLGLRLTFDHMGNTWDESASSFDPGVFSPLFTGYGFGAISNMNSFSQYDLMHNVLLSSNTEQGDFKTTLDNNSFRCLLSYMNPVFMHGKDGEMRYDLNLQFDDNNAAVTEDEYNASYYQYLSSTSNSTGAMTMSHEIENEMPRNEVFLGARYRCNMDAIEPRYKQGFWEVGLGVGGFGGTFEDKSAMKTDYYRLLFDSTSPQTQAFTKYSSRDEFSGDGNYMGFHTRLMGRSALNFSENVTFGYGLTFDLQTFERKGDYDNVFNSMYYTRIGEDNATATFNRLTLNQVYGSRQEITQTNLVTTLPVGLEFSLPQSSLTDNDAFSLRNFTFRLGTLFTHNYKALDERSKVNEVADNTQTAETQNGVVSQTIVSDLTLSNYRNKSCDTNGSKKYTAGIGYNHSDFLNIDLASYIDSNGEEFFIGLMFTVKK